MTRGMARFMLEYLEQTEQSFIMEKARIYNEVIFELVVQTESILIGGIASLEKGKGNASVALDWIVSLARKHEVTLTGRALRLGKQGLTFNQLKTWYYRHGFTVKPDGHITLDKNRATT